MGLDKIIADRVGNKGIGFNSEIAGPTSTDENELLRQVLPQDLNAFGMIPEFIGRTPVITQTCALTEDDLVSILTEPKNAIVKQLIGAFVSLRIAISIRAGGASRDCPNGTCAQTAHVACGLSASSCCSRRCSTCRAKTA